MSDAFDAIGLGHNQPPLADQLTIKYAELLSQVEPIAERANAAPKEVTNDTEDGDLSKIIADATKLHKSIEATRVNEKAPFLKAERDVDGVFNPHRDRLEKMSAILNKRVAAYKRKKADEERAERERLAREERERQRKAEEEALRLQEEAEAAERANRIEEADTKLGDAIIAEADSVRIGGDAAKLEKQAQAKPAEMARTRSGSTLSTLQTFWDFEIIDRNRIDLNWLRPYLSDDAIDKAVRAAVRAGKRTIAQVDAGPDAVRVFENDKALVRG